MLHDQLGEDHCEAVEEDDEQRQGPEERHHGGQDGERQSPQGADVASARGARGLRTEAG